jgi:hypothetical protein
MTNTLSSVYLAMTSNYTAVVDGLIAIALLVFAAKAGVALVKAWVAHRVRVN